MDKRTAFVAYQNSKISDEELEVVIKSLEDLIETFHAMDETGTFILGFYLMLDSARQMQYFRRKDF